MGLRERKRKSTRLDISRAALQLAVERGVAATTIEEIARMANVAPRTLFNHFASKEAAILAIDRDRPIEVASLLLARPPHESPLEALMHATFEPGSGLGPTIWRQRSLLVRSDAGLAAVYAGPHSLEAVATAMATRLGLEPAGDIFPLLVVTVGFDTMRTVVEHLVDRWPWSDDVPEEQIRTEILNEVRRTLACLEQGLVAPAPRTN